jgi:hypothetical protein
MSKEESGANVERPMVAVRQQGEWPSGLKESDEVSEAARENRAYELGKSPLTLFKA